jgi:hypothetical protein
LDNVLDGGDEDFAAGPVDDIVIVTLSFQNIHYIADGFSPGGDDAKADNLVVKVAVFGRMVTLYWLHFQQNAGGLLGVPQAGGSDDRGERPGSPVG